MDEQTATIETKVDPHPWTPIHVSNAIKKRRAKNKVAKQSRKKNR